MRTKPKSQWIPPFLVFETHLGKSALYDIEMNLPLVYGTTDVINAFIQKYLPPETDITWYWKRTPKSTDGNFVWRMNYRGISPAEQAESDEAIQKHNHPKVEKV